MFPIRTRKILIIPILIAALGCMPSTALAAPQPDLDTGTWLAPLQGLSSWFSGLFGDDPSDQPEAIWQEVGCGADPDGTPCESKVEPAPATRTCDSGSGIACREIPVV
jgi:hypothetical protein